MSLTLTSYLQGVDNQTLNPHDIINEYCLKASHDKLNAYITVTDEYARQQCQTMDLYKLPLHGAPICLKDNICTKGIRTTCASKILDTYIAPYDATCRSKLHDTGATLIGKANMDEFAM
jgi:aspartyl-tRNA(Asn)/glutamyl-tRNA(Gln) amidotransferase subunit A